MRGSRAITLVAAREWAIVRRSRAAGGVAVVLLALAWLPPVLVAARAGRLGLAGFEEIAPLSLAIGGVVLPLLALLAGANLMAADLEDRSLVLVVTLPIGRGACFLGKVLGLLGVVAGAYLMAFGSAALAVLSVRGSSGLGSYLTLTACGLLLMACCLLVGASLGASGRGRVRAYAAALTTWVVLVFVVDAVLLAAVVALAPEPPTAIGQHGHDELGGVEADRGGSAPGGAGSSVEWVMLANPVDLYRLTALQADAAMRPPGSGAARPAPGRPASARSAVTWLRLAIGWAAWLLVPIGIGLRRFGRACLV